jgi:N-acetylglutamate synthase-like GNAT family acetyltransferase
MNDMKNISIEVYSEKYKLPVSELILDIQRNEFGVPITLEQQPDLNAISEFYQKGNGNFWIAIHNKEVIGTIALIDIGNQQIALRKMFVHKDYRGKESGTGQALLDKAIDWMKEKECREVFLGTVHVFIAAQKFYRRNGFEEIPKSDLPMDFPAMKLDDTFFKKRIEPQTELKILSYEKQYQPWFENLNRAWIEKYFRMEPIDFEVLQHPDVHIIDHGGHILMATLDKEIVGTVALKYVKPGVYEFTKMAVDEKYHAKGIGKALAEAAIDKAKTLGADKIILYSNTKLAPAIKLYRRLGFQEIPVDGPYKRCDIKMELPL